MDLIPHTDGAGEKKQDHAALTEHIIARWVARDSGFALLRGLILPVACMLLSGCSSVASVGPFVNPLQGGSPPLQVHEQTSVRLSSDNFTLVKTNVWGRSRGFRLLGFITIYPATFTKAMSRMYGAAQLRTGEPQTLAHFTVENSASYWILFSIPAVEVHADVVAFKPTAPGAGNRRGRARARSPG